jgi:hypothetical protein
MSRKLMWRFRKGSENQNRTRVLSCGCVEDIYERVVIRRCDEHRNPSQNPVAKRDHQKEE